MTDNVEQPVKRKRGRPRKDETRAVSRPERVPVSGNRDILTVRGKNPEYHYRWVKDTDEDGQRILKFRNAGYEFCGSDEGLQVGQNMVFKSENVGSIVRKPAGSGEYFYLMRIYKEWYEEDQAAKQREIDAMDAQIKRPRNPDNAGDDGQYGQNILESQMIRISND